MHTNNAVRHKRNKHGRKGVTRATRNLPLADAQAIEIKERAFMAGYDAGARTAIKDAAAAVNAAKTIRAARKILEEMAK